MSYPCGTVFRSRASGKLYEYIGTSVQKTNCHVFVCLDSDCPAVLTERYVLENMKAIC